MEKYKVGYFYYEETEKDYYTDDFVHFFKSDNTELDKKDLEQWIIWSNSPWSQVHKDYIISVNCKDEYTKINPNEPIWKCTYEVIGYDGITTGIIGYGNTKIEALNDCDYLFKSLQEKYNPDNIKI